MLWLQPTGTKGNTMSDKRMTAPVTDELLRELINTDQLLAQYTGDDAKINDRDHYGAAVLQLEALAKAVLFAQAAVPAPIQQRISAELKTALEDAGLQKKMAALGDVAFYRSPEDLNRYVGAETARWVPIIRASGIALD